MRVLALFVLGAGVSMAAWMDVLDASERLQEAGRLVEAERVLVAAMESEHGVGLAHVLNNLGSVCQDQRRFEEAERHYRRAVAEWERAGDPYRMALARTLNNLASLLWEERKLAEADRLLIRSAELQIAAVGVNHAKAASLYYNLGTLHFNQNRWPEAEGAYRQFLTIGAGEPLQVAVVAGNLALICRKSGRGEEAEALFGRAKRIWGESGGAGQAAFLVDLATSFWSGNLLAEAAAVGRTALQQAEQRFGEAHPRTAQALNLYAAILRRMNRKAEARAMEKRAKEIETERRGTVDVNELKGVWKPGV